MQVSRSQECSSVASLRSSYIWLASTRFNSNSSYSNRILTSRRGIRALQYTHWGLATLPPLIYTFTLNSSNCFHHAYNTNKPTPILTTFTRTLDVSARILRGYKSRSHWRSINTWLATTECSCSFYVFRPHYRMKSFNNSAIFTVHTCISIIITWIHRTNHFRKCKFLKILTNRHQFAPKQVISDKWFCSFLQIIRHSQYFWLRCTKLSNE